MTGRPAGRGARPDRDRLATAPPSSGSVAGYLDHLDRRARPGRQHARLLPARPAPLRSSTWPTARRRRRSREIAESDVAGFLAALRAGRRRAPAAVGDVGGARGRRRARAAPLRAARRAGRRSTSAREVRPPAAAAAAAQGDPGRGRGAAARRGRVRRATALALRDRALLELLYGTGARISEAVGLAVDDLDLAERTVLLRRQGRQAAAACRSARYAARGGRGLPGAGPARRWPRPGRGAPAAVPQRARRPAVAAVRVGRPADRGRAGRAAPTGDLAAHAAALVRHPPARRRRRRPRGAGTARPRLGDDHPDLHAGHRRPAARGVRDRPPARARG